MVNGIIPDSTNILSNITVAKNKVIAPPIIDSTNILSNITVAKDKTSLDCKDMVSPKIEKINSGNAIGSIDLCDSPELDKEQIQNDYADFVKTRWEELKSEHVEIDCKGLALKFLSDFTKYYKETKNIDLPYPGDGSVVDDWAVFTKEDPKDMATQITKETTRADYKSVLKKNPDQEILFGTNYLFTGGADANKVANTMTKDVTSRAEDGKSIIQDHPSSMQSNKRKITPEVDINQLKSGDLIFLDHAGDGKWDHTVNVINVEKDVKGKVQTITLAVGSYDDMRDTDPETKPSPKDINLYTEEVKIHFNKNGQATQSETTWSSEPTKLFGKRYNITNTLMDLHQGGKIKVGVWDFPSSK